MAEALDSHTIGGARGGAFQRQSWEVETRLQSAKTALIDQLGRLPGEMLVSLLAFSDHVTHVLTAPAGSVDRFRMALVDLSPSGGTNIGAALNAAADLAGQSVGPPRVLLLTDGGSDVTSALVAAERCRRLGITIDALLIDPNEESERLIAEITGKTAGQWTPVETAEDLRVGAARSSERASPVAANARPDAQLEVDTQREEDAERDVRTKAVTVSVLFATDRARTGIRDPNKFFAGERGPLVFGTVDVSIPYRHRMGQLESPKLFRFEFREDSSSHIMLKSVSVAPEEDFISQLRRRVAASSSKHAFVFIHGYNVSFRDAARRTAQLHFDLGFDGPPILYSWPSQGRVKSYPIDLTNSQWTIHHLERFLQTVSRTSGADIIHIIAHSMGNRPLVDALTRMSVRSPIFREVVLTAPDIDAEVFADLAQKMIDKARRVTVYASSRDRTLNLSKRFNGFPRAGDASFGLLAIPGIDVIDASAVDTSFMGHSYFSETRTVLTDIFYLLRGEVVQERAGIRQLPGQKTWIFAP